MTGEVVHHGGTRTDDRAVAELHAVAHAGADSEVHGIPQFHPAAETRTGSKVGKIANGTVMIDGTGGIENDMSANGRRAADDRAGQGNKALAELSGRRNDRRRVYDGENGKPESGKVRSDLFPGATVSETTHANHGMVDAIPPNLFQLIIGAENGNAGKRSETISVQEANNLNFLTEVENLEENLGVAAGSDTEGFNQGCWGAVWSPPVRKSLPKRSTIISTPSREAWRPSS
ncbi:hypothetical protein BH09VER1_BH09VER1_18620 [soil metagenome]